MKDKQPHRQIVCPIYGRLNCENAKENDTVRDSNEEPSGNFYLINGRLQSINVKRTSTEATMALTHWVSNDRNRRGTTLGHSPCNERNQQQLDAINT